MSWHVRFYADDEGRQPVRVFLRQLDPPKRAALIAAVEMVLTPLGLAVCNTEYGKALGRGLYGFRIRHDERTIRAKAGAPGTGARQGEVLLRVFFAAYADHVVLLLGGYDKGDDPSGRRQSREIEQARARLRSFKLRQERRAAGKRRQR